ncbi:uncharacterized protein LACBIDRAFT_304606 [Laccaria bicolor S238N-H82]|uniref:Predicted protein n=1 Tax=Laccaria bicolor (strain S238N-H82 / ATCC MYA-4686) TaxID=486041 RepID=B0DM00_LACBS|nr:uncharacterized protein LACBIDRAFT_304606 [Laccaria bicolor S238N-H82]EDR04382.1 predicted protein [Laccaria bicolor S238N-H82]|eukprot:XP_001884901.1 predicted protein [Laccaria bicolor S238N-H82]
MSPMSWRGMSSLTDLAPPCLFLRVTHSKDFGVTLVTVRSTIRLYHPHSPVPSVQNLGALQENTESREVKTVGRPSNDNPLFGLPQDGRYKPSELQDLTAAFTRLSTSNNPGSSTGALFQACTPPGPSATRLSPRKGLKYYAIIIGKCIGVYYGEWDDVRCLIDYVTGAQYKSFKSLAEAAEFYLEHKTKHKVRVVRNPGDGDRFGPEADAIQ